jgi:hypothetical protein
MERAEGQQYENLAEICVPQILGINEEAGIGGNHETRNTKVHDHQDRVYRERRC